MPSSFAACVWFPPHIASASRMRHCSSVDLSLSGPPARSWEAAGVVGAPPAPLDELKEVGVSVDDGNVLRRLSYKGAIGLLLARPIPLAFAPLAGVPRGHREEPWSWSKRVGFSGCGVVRRQFAAPCSHAICRVMQPEGRVERPPESCPVSRAGSIDKIRPRDACARESFAGSCSHPAGRPSPWRRPEGVAGQRRRRGRARAFCAGEGGVGPSASSFGLSLGRYDSPSMTKS